MPISGVQGSAYRMSPYQPFTFTTGMRIHLRAEDYTGGATWPNYYTGLNAAPAATVVGSPVMQIIQDGLNGKPVIRFTANEGRVRGTGLIAGGVSMYDVAVCFVARQWGPNKGRMFSNQYDGTTKPYNWLVGAHGAGEPACYDNGWIPAVPAGWGAIPTPWKIYSYQSTLRFDPPPNSVNTFRANGTQIGAATSSSGHDTAWGLSGLDPLAAGETGDFEVAEFLGFNYSAVSITSVEQYLRDRWGLNRP